MPMNESVQSLDEKITQLCDEIYTEYVIHPSNFVGDAVKRGLRNADGTGVMAGVTRVGSVQGYYVLDGQRVPMPGELFYRGINVNEIVEHHRENSTFGFEEYAVELLEERGFSLSRNGSGYICKEQSQRFSEMSME